jgi:agmatinase
MSEKAELIHDFDQNGIGLKGRLFGLPYLLGEAQLVIVPLPWEVTVTSQTGTATGPEKIIKVSSEIDLFSKEIDEVWKLKVVCLDTLTEIKKQSDQLRSLAALHIQSLESGKAEESSRVITQKVNEGCENLNVYVSQLSRDLFAEGKMVGLVGGDHSTPLGLLRTLNEKFSNFGILQIDAHADLRKSYQNFTYSHGSIMFNALKLKNLSRLVQVGVRDFCEEEYSLIQKSTDRVKTFFDSDIKEQLFNGKPWGLICQEVIDALPDLIYISFDIDGLRPELCPNTGTPVPGGLSFEEVIYLIKQVVLSGKRIIAFDLSEVSGQSNWDAQTGSRILFELCNWMAVSQGQLKLTHKVSVHL